MTRARKSREWYEVRPSRDDPQKFTKIQLARELRAEPLCSDEYVVHVREVLPKRKGARK